jgi:hypothetical protein
MNNEDKIVAALKELGNSPDEIAKSLSDLGITGYRRSCKACPIHNYLEKKGLFTNEIDHYNWIDFIHWHQPSLAGVLQFIYAFDDHNYVELNADQSA